MKKGPDESPGDRPTRPPEGEDPTQGQWVYVHMLDGPCEGRTLWRWKRADGSFYYKYEGCGCMIFTAVGLLTGFGGIGASIAYLLA